jgi:hypothetical protein
VVEKKEEERVLRREEAINIKVENPKNVPEKDVKYIIFIKNRIIIKI